MEKFRNATNLYYIFLGIVVLIVVIGGIWLAISKNSNEVKQVSSNVKIQKQQTTNTDNEDNVEKEKIIAINERKDEKDWEITIKKSGFAQDVKPSNPGSYYTHYQVGNTDNTYFYLILEVKNISNLALRADKVAKIKMIYDDKYEYNTFSTIEYRNGESFTYTNITNIDPLTTGKIYYLVEVPKSISDDSKSIKCEITIGENQYTYNMR